MKGLIDFNLSKDRFLAEFADKEMFLIRSAVNPGIIKWSDINDVLYYGDIAPPNFRIRKANYENVPPEKYLEDFSVGGQRAHRLNTAVVQELLIGGATAVINRIDARLPAIRDLCEDISEFTDTETRANAYLAMAGEGPFGVHWDTHDVMVIQLIGSKRWKVFKPTLPLPVYGQSSKHRQSECPSIPVFDGILEAGDLLYLPRGWWHVVTPFGETLHATIGMYAPTILHYLAWLGDCVFQNHIELRQTLRLGAAAPDSLRQAAEKISELLKDHRQFDKYMMELTHLRVKPRTPFALESLRSAINANKI